VADVAWKAMKEGRDVRAITAMLDRTYGDETGHVDEPHTLDELAKLSREQRRALITQLEREGRSSPFRAPEHEPAQSSPKRRLRKGFCRAPLTCLDGRHDDPVYCIDDLGRLDQARLVCVRCGPGVLAQLLQQLLNPFRSRQYCRRMSN
jgi:hypothetical protein